MGFLLLFDVTNESSFLSIQNWLTFIDTYTEIDNDLRPPILLIGNKIDLVTNRIIDTIQAQKLANELQITYIETSAVTGTNVQETLRVLIEHIFEFMNRSMQKYYLNLSPTIQLTVDQEQLQQRRRTTSIKLKNKIAQAKKQGCPCT
jgi:GTPase SAR1 family protein